MCATKVQPPSAGVHHPSILQTRGCHLCDPSHSGMGGTHLCYLDPLTETSRGGSSPMSPSTQKRYPRALQGLHRCLLRRGLRPPPPLQSMGPHYRAPPHCQTPKGEEIPPLIGQEEETCGVPQEELGKWMNFHFKVPD